MALTSSQRKSKPGGEEPRARTSSRPPGPATRARSGQRDEEEIEAFTDEEYARATGLHQILDEEGRADPARVPQLAPAEHVRIFEGMLLSRTLDDRLMPLQRQGRIGWLRLR